MADSAELRDVELMRRLSGGDEEAFLEFYRRHQGGLYRYAVHMSGRPEGAADVVQETFLTLIRQKDRYEEAKGSPAAFLYGIARNHLRKLHEREARYVPLADENGGAERSRVEARRPNGNGFTTTRAVAGEPILDALERAQFTELLREAVRTLPEHYREAVTVCDLEGKSYHAAATLLGCPVGTVRSRLNRARSILLEKLRPARIATAPIWARPGAKNE